MKIFTAVTSLSAVVFSSLLLISACQSEAEAENVTPRAAVDVPLAVKRGEPDNTNTKGVSEAQKTFIIQQIKSIDPAISGEIKVENSPVPGIVWVMLPSKDIFLFSQDGQYMLGNQLRSLINGKLALVASDLEKKAKAQADAYASWCRLMHMHQAAG